MCFTVIFIYCSDLQVNLQYLQSMPVHEDVHRLHANTTPFYIRESSSRDFGFSGGWTSEQIPADTRRPLCFTFYTTSQSVLAVSSAQKPQVTRLAIKLKSARLDCVHMGC